MGTLGDLLEAMHDAPRATTFRGRAIHGHDSAKMHEAMDRFNRTGGGGVFFATSGTAPAGSPAADGMVESPLAFWYSEGRWRLDLDGMIVIGDGAERFSFHPASGGVISPVESTDPPFGGVGMYFMPDRLLGSARVTSVDSAVAAGRPCWRVRLRPTASGRLGGSLHLLHTGEDFEVLVDRALGIILRCEGRLDGEVASKFEITELVVDEEIDPAVFAFMTPDGSRVRSHGEMLLAHAAERGADVAGVDADDLEQVQQVFRTAMFATDFGPGFGGPADLDQIAAQHIPTGPPPDDEQDARIDVGVAFERIGEVSDDGQSVPSVQRGENLGPTARAVRERYLGGGSDASRLRVDLVKFLNDHEAVVWFSVFAAERIVLPSFKGTAVLDGGEWKVSRATFCELHALAGVACPPPEPR